MAEKLVVLQGTGTFQRRGSPMWSRSSGVKWKKRLRRAIPGLFPVCRGVDLMFAAIVAEQMEHRPELFLEAAIPYAGRLKTKISSFKNCCGPARALRWCVRNMPPHALCSATVTWPGSPSG